MSNTSATGGALLPDSTPSNLEDNALVDFFQAWVVGITGLAGQFVRPRWQPESVNIPDQTVNWAALGIVKREADVNAAELHYQTGNGYNQTRRHEVLYLLASFYGPGAGGYAARLRDGMQVAQNREPLTVANMGLVESGDLTQLPELVKDKWYMRVDLDFKIRRQVVSNYPILNLLSTPVISVPTS
jgi:hypothetical protein